MNRRDRDVPRGIRTFLRALLSVRALKHLIETFLLPWVPSHTSAMAPRTIGPSPTLTILPDTMYDDGRVALRPHMACNLCRHARATSSVVGMVLRACGVCFVNCNHERLKGQHVLYRGNPPAGPTPAPAAWLNTAPLRHAGSSGRAGARNQGKKC